MVLLIGVSYAVWRYTFTGSANTIETSKIELELLESTDEIIRVENALPMSDEEGKSQTKTFNFAVTTRTKGVQNIGYSLKLEKLSVDSGYTALNDNQIKVYLTDYNNNELLGPTLVSNLSDYVLYSKINSYDGSIEEIQDKYKLRVWIDKDVLVNDWNESTKLQYKFKIGVGEKRKEIPSVVYSFSSSKVSQGAQLESISGYTTDYTTLNKDFFLKHNIDSDGTVETNELCYILNGNQYCLKGCSKYSREYDYCDVSNYEEDSEKILSSFGDENCEVYRSLIVCSLPEFFVQAADDDYVYAHFEDCDINYDGSADCDGNW